MNKAKIAAFLALFAASASATPVSREYVDQRLTAASNRLDEAVAGLESKIAAGSSSRYYIYDDGSKPSTNLLDAAGRLFELSL